jgi:Putative MetA-pathway of phenol degradation
MPREKVTGVPVGCWTFTCFRIMGMIFNQNRVHWATVLLCLLPSLSVANAQTQEEEKDQNQSQEQKKPAGQQQQEDQNSTELVAVPNRPTFATTAETVQRGVLEIEFGFEAADSHQNLNGLLKFGLFKNLELRIANNPFERDQGVAGQTDTGAGFKFKVFPQKGPRPTFSVLYTATLPTATQALGAGGVGQSVQILLSKDLGKHHIDLNEGVQFVARQGAGGFDRNYFSSFSYSHPISGKWGWTGEVAGFSWTNATTPSTMVLLGAATYSPSPRLVFDGGVYIAAYGNLPRVTGFAGFTFAIADLYHLHAARKSGKN